MGPMRRMKQPEWVQPMLATLTRDYFSDPEWVFEPKLDGIRCVAFKQGSDVKTRVPVHRQTATAQGSLLVETEARRAGRVQRVDE